MWAVSCLHTRVIEDSHLSTKRRKKMIPPTGTMMGNNLMAMSYCVSILLCHRRNNVKIPCTCWKKLINKEFLPVLACLMALMNIRFQIGLSFVCVDSFHEMIAKTYSFFHHSDYGKNRRHTIHGPSEASSSLQCGFWQWHYAIKILAALGALFAVGDTKKLIFAADLNMDKHNHTTLLYGALRNSGSQTHTMPHKCRVCMRNKLKLPPTLMIPFQHNLIKISKASKQYSIIFMWYAHLIVGSFYYFGSVFTIVYCCLQFLHLLFISYFIFIL